MQASLSVSFLNILNGWARRFTGEATSRRPQLFWAVKHDEWEGATLWYVGLFIYQRTCTLVPSLTQQVGWNGSFQVDPLLAVLIEESPANVGVQVEVERLQLLPQVLQVLLKRGRLIQGAPEGSVVAVACGVITGISVAASRVRFRFRGIKEIQSSRNWYIYIHTFVNEFIIRIHFSFDKNPLP